LHFVSINWYTKLMKRLLLLILTFTLLLSCSFTLTNAQNFDAAKALSDYVYNLNLYRTAYQNYTNAKKEYKNYQTLTSETKALEVTKVLLNQRATTIKTYLTAVRMKLQESTSILSYDQNLLYVKIDDEVTWIPAHQVEYNSAGTINDLLKTSAIFQNRYPDQELLAFKALGQIVFQEEKDLSDEANTLIQKTETKIAQMREAGEDTAVEERWLIQAKEKIKRSEEKRTAALAITNNLKATSNNKLAYWNQAQVLYVEGNQYLKEACSNLREIIREVKSAN
jgi:hypothetical protein